MPAFYYVAIGAFFGAIGRFWMGRIFTNKTFPYGTLIVNLVGSFLLGFIIGYHPHQYIQLMFGTGFMGAFTTFSTFKTEHLGFQATKQWKKLIIYIVLSYGLGLVLAWLGYKLGH